MAVEMPEVEGHPNRAGFRGVLTVVDVPSQRAPSGSKGHRVVLTRAAAEAALPSLLGMALDYAPSFDRHDQRRKVGVVTSAEIVGRNLEVGGFLYAKDFPDIVEEIAKSGRRPKAELNFVPPSTASGPTLSAESGGRRGYAAALQAAAANEGARSHGTLRAALAAAVGSLREMLVESRQNPRSVGRAEISAAAGSLGMSYEVADVTLADTRSRLWILTKVTFTGAAILRRDKAAYADTWIELVV